MRRGAPIERVRGERVPLPVRRDVLVDASPPPRPSHDPERLRRAEWRTLVRDEHGRFLASVATDGAEQRNPQSGRGLSRADRAPLARLVRRSNSRAWGEHHGALNGRMLPIEIEFSAKRRLKFLKQCDVHFGFQGRNAMISIRREWRGNAPLNCETAINRQLNFERIETEIDSTKRH